MGMTEILGSLGIRVQRQLLGLGKLKPKQAKYNEYHKEKMILCKQESKGVPISVEMDEWLHETDDDPDE
ncbi:hypothetical protein Tco_0427833 [Tanacetum coccineum]